MVAAAGQLSPADYTAAGVAWTVIRGTAYDLTGFLAAGAHPGGDALVRLAVGRDATALVETNHLRQEQPAAALKGLPVLHGFPVEQVPQAPRPSDSPLYRSIRARTVAEVFAGAPRRGAGKGGEAQAGLSLALLLAAGALWLSQPGPVAGLLLGLAAAFASMVLFHAGNHGALSTSTLLNGTLALAGDLVGASSLPWRYKHQVSHHVWTGDHVHDMDLQSPFPRLRFDARLPKLGKHRYQYLYMWALFPLMYLTFFMNNWRALLLGSAGPLQMAGASRRERATSLALNLAHIWLVLGLPLGRALRGGGGGGASTVPAVLLGAVLYTTSLSFILGCIFAVSHNTPESKRLLPARNAATAIGSRASTGSAASDGGSTSDSDSAGEGNDSADSSNGSSGAGAGGSAPSSEEGDALEDWGKAQVYHSANWGGVWANYLTGGLSLQIEHHLFPAIYPGHYPAISRIVAEECAAHGVQYKHYQSFGEIARLFAQAAHELGA